VERGPHTGVGFLSGPVTLVTTWVIHALPVGKDHTEAVYEEWQPMGTTHMGDSLPWEGHHPGAGEESEESSPLRKTE